MTHKLFSSLFVLLNVLWCVFAHRDRHDSSEDEDGHDKEKKGGKLVVICLIGAVLAATVIGVVVMCYCKKKKTQQARTKPDLTNIQAGPLPDKTPVYNITTEQYPSPVYNNNNPSYPTSPGYEQAPPLYSDKQGLERDMMSPPPAYTFK